MLRSLINRLPEMDKMKLFTVPWQFSRRVNAQPISGRQCGVGGI